MYEDYLENFVFKTAKFIAMKLFGRVRRPQKEQASENETKDNNRDKEATESSNTEEEESNLPKENDLTENVEQKALVKSDSQSILEKSDEDKSSEEIEKMLEELLTKQREEKLKNEKNQGFSRVEYDSLTEGLDEINFHLPLFFLLVVITILGLPSVVTWAKNYHFTRILSPDPMKISATVVLSCLGFIWQLNTPRDV